VLRKPRTFATLDARVMLRQDLCRPFVDGENATRFCADRSVESPLPRPAARIFLGLIFRSETNPLGVSYA